ncbi:ComF family protein [Edaphobacter aggregans]|uniref:ComF family protein n=1 Tax=Edaphobacter aggregans TaxID=570835 RepID=UPI00068D1017|nr:ComF family protein [Edaphobacter aggregans]
MLKSPVELARTVFEDLVTTFFPGDCSACGGPLLGVGSTSLCDGCIDALRAQPGTLCARCGEALDIDGVRYERQFGAGPLLCSPCRMVPPVFERAVAWGVYEDQMRELTQMLKYERVRSVAEPLGRLLARVIEGLGDAAGGGVAMSRDVGVVVAVPLYRAKQRQRGFNQSVLLADVALRELRRRGSAWRLREAHGAMLRTRDTESQFGLTPGGRRRNLRGAFEVIDPAAVAGREVLLVDDIYTTGATARECARVLRQAGAERVWVATVSRAQREMVAAWDAGNAAETAVWDAG